MSAALAFSHTLIAALVVLVFAAIAVAAVQTVQMRLLDRKVSRLLSLHRVVVEDEGPEWFQKIRKVIG